MHSRHGLMITVLATTCALALSWGCKKKGEVTVVEQQVIEEEKEEYGSAEDQKKAWQAEQNPAMAEQLAKDKGEKYQWGKQVKGVAREVSSVLLECNDTYFKKLKPGQLLIGKPALVTDDQVVTVLARDCDAIMDGLQTMVTLAEGKHPDADALLAQWTLLADVYNRTRSVAINPGAPPKSRKLGHDEMVLWLPKLTGELVPSVSKALGPFITLDDDAEPTPEKPSQQKVSKEEAITLMTAAMDKTTADVQALEAVWMEHCHDPLKAGLWARRRHLNYVDRSWTRRLAYERLMYGWITTGDNAFNTKYQAAAAAYLALVDDYLNASWKVGMKAIEDVSEVDENLLIAGKDGYKKGGKAFAKALKKFKLPN